MSSVRTILASLFTVLGGFCLLALTIGAGFAIYIWTIPDSVSAPAAASVASRPPKATADTASSVEADVPRFAPVALAQAAPVSSSTKPAGASDVHQTALAQPDDSQSSSAMLTRAWAPAAMLTPPKEATAPPAAKVVSDAAAPNFSRPNSVLASNDQTVTEPQASPAPPVAPARFEGGTPLPPAQMADPSADPSKPSPGDQSTQPVKTKKTKTARRRPAKDETVETTISKGFDSLQRSISSMF